MLVRPKTLIQTEKGMRAVNAVSRNKCNAGQGVNSRASALARTGRGSSSIKICHVSNRWQCSDGSPDVIVTEKNCARTRAQR